MTSKETIGRELTLLSFLARALSHQVRGHLAVISNDLQYFTTLLPEGECQRSIARTKEISKIFDAITALLGEKFSPDEFPLADAVREGFASKASVDLMGVSVMIVGDKALLSKAFGFLGQLLRESCQKESIEAVGELSVRMSCQPSSASVLIEFPLARRATPDRRDQTGWCSFAGFFSGVFDTDSFVPCFIDAVLWGHGCEIKIAQADSLQINVLFFLED